MTSLVAIFRASTTANQPAAATRNGSVPQANNQAPNTAVKAYDNPVHADATPPPQYDETTMSPVFPASTSQYNDSKYM